MIYLAIGFNYKVGNNTYKFNESKEFIYLDDGRLIMSEVDGVSYYGAEFVKNYKEIKLKEFMKDYNFFKKQFIVRNIIE